MIEKDSKVDEYNYIRSLIGTRNMKEIKYKRRAIRAITMLDFSMEIRNFLKELDENDILRC